MNNAARVIEEGSRQVRAAVTAMLAELDATGAGFQGATKNAAVGAMDMLGTNLQTLATLLENASTTLQTAGFGFGDQDDTASSAITAAGSAVSGGVPSSSPGGSSTPVLVGAPLNQSV
jgi:uncharacterized protein YukE